jgi:hypothetical protein
MRRDPSRARPPDEPGADRRDHDRDFRSLAPEQLRWRSDLERLAFETTDQLVVALDVPRADRSPDLLGQPRAVQALDFGLGIEDEGFNLFALGPAGCGKRELVTELLERKAATRPVADDWCYVHNFDDASRPRALRLPPGTARHLQRDMEKLVEDLRNALASAMESEEYHARRHEIEQELQEHHEQIFEELREESEKRGLTPIRTPTGVALAAVADGEPISPEEMQKLPKERRDEIEKAAAELHRELQRKLRQMPRIQRTLREKLDELSREFAHIASVGLIEELQERYRELPQVVAYLAEVQRDVVADARRLVARATEEERRAERDRREEAPTVDDDRGSRLGPARRYRVNVLVEHRDEVTAPVVYEGNPTLRNLIGEVDRGHRSGQPAR